MGRRGGPFNHITPKPLNITENIYTFITDFCADCGATIGHFFFELVLATPKFGKPHYNSQMLWCLKCGKERFEYPTKSA
jgi:hypothetical protein